MLCYSTLWVDNMMLPPNPQVEERNLWYGVLLYYVRNADKYLWEILFIYFNACFC